MARVPVALAFALSLSMILAACGSPETPASEKAQPTEPAATEPLPVMPDDAPPQEEAGPDESGASTEGTCTASIGAAAATRLAERCTMVSPASHPPCNPANPCALIQDEIDRSCAQYGAGEAKPAECAA